MLPPNARTSFQGVYCPTVLQPSPNLSQGIRFGPFEVDINARALRKRGVRVRLQAQPFEVLAALLEHPGTVVTREEFRRRVWPQDTFVDFQHGLTAAVARLRQALGDSAASQRYIETVPRCGYRFAGELHPPVAVAVATTPPPSRGPLPLAEGHTYAEFAPRLVGLMYVTVLIVAVALSVALFRSEKPLPTYSPIPVTSFKGAESSPSLSPDGNFVVFAWCPEGGNSDIYTMRLGSTAPTRVTGHPAPDLTPVWSPDGQNIAFLRRKAIELADLVVVPASGGSERVIAEVRNVDLRAFPAGMRVSALSWSPDGRWIAASHRAPGAATEGIHLFSQTGEQKQLTFPPLQSHGDHAPAFSPDGRNLVFCRLPGFSTSEIHLLQLDTSAARAEPLRLTHHDRWSVNPAWTPDGRRVVYIFSQLTNARSRRELRQVNIAAKSLPERTIPFDGDVYQVSIGRSLVYSTLRMDTNIWRARIPTEAQPTPAVAEAFLSSTQPDHGARYSPDGKKISFVSMRSGSPEIWVANADGSDPTRVTSLRASVLTPPAWSPDGQRLVFSSQHGPYSSLFTVAAAGGKSPARLTNTAFDENMPTYSRDGRSIYFNSMRSGRRQVWRIPAGGGDAVQITTGGGLRPVESPEGGTIYYVAESGGAIWKVPAAGGTETKVVSCVHDTAYGFAVTIEGIYYRDCSGESKQHIQFHDIKTGQNRPVSEATDLPFGTSLSVSPDRKYIVFDQAASIEMDLMLAEKL